MKFFSLNGTILKKLEGIFKKKLIRFSNFCYQMIMHIGRCTIFPALEHCRSPTHPKKRTKQDNQKVLGVQITKNRQIIIGKGLKMF